MKFILALAVVALAATGCGQGHGNQDRSVPPPTAVSNTKAALEADLATVPGTGQSYAEQTAALQAALNDTGQPVQVSPDAKSVGERIGTLTAMVNTLQKSFDQAKANRDNSIHLPYAFLDATAWSFTSGAFGVNGVKALHRIYMEKFNRRYWDNLKKTPDAKALNAPANEVASEASGAAKAAEMAAAEKEANLFQKIAASKPWGVTTDYVVPVTGRLAETAGAVVLGVYALGKITVLYNDIVIKIHNTPAMAFYSHQLDVAKTNLDQANRELDAVNMRDVRASNQ